MDEKKKQLYNVLKNYEKLAYCRGKKFNLAYNYYKTLDIATSMPVILISAFTGSINFSNTFSCDEHLSIMVSSLNIFCAALLGIGRFFKFGDTKEQCKNTMASYDKMFNRIYMEMNMIDDKTEIENIKRCISETERFYEQIHATSPMIPMFINKREFDMNTDNSIFLSRTIEEDKNIDDDQC